MFLDLGIGMLYFPAPGDLFFNRYLYHNRVRHIIQGLSSTLRILLFFLSLKNPPTHGAFLKVRVKYPFSVLNKVVVFFDVCCKWVVLPP